MRLLGSLLALVVRGDWLDPCESPSDADSATWESHVAFVKAAGGKVDPRICLATGDDSGIRSIYASTDIREGEVLFASPPAALLGLDKSGKKSKAGYESLLFVAKLAQDIGIDIKAGPAVRNVLFAVFLHQLMRQAEVTASSPHTISQWASKYPTALSFGPYLRMLWEASTGNLPLVRAAEGIGDWTPVEGSLLLKRVSAQLQGLRNFHERLEANAKAQERLPFKMTLADLARAVAIIASRPVVGDNQKFLLTPAVDFMNHGANHNVAHRASEREEGVWLEAYATRDIDEGEEVTIDYMRNGARPIGDVFEAYGFTVPTESLKREQSDNRCAGLMSALEADFAVLMEAKSSWEGIEVPDAEGLEDGEAEWLESVRRVREEENGCIARVLAIAEDETKKSNAPPAHTEL